MATTPPDLAALAAWQNLLDKDDRTSPEEYPEMALITFEEFEALAALSRTAGRAEEGAHQAKVSRMFRALNGLDIDDIDAQADAMLRQAFDGVTVGPSNRLTLKGYLAEHLAASKERGRAEGLEEAAKWRDAEAMQAELSAARLEAAGLDLNAGHWRVEAREARARAAAIRALASDPAPGDDEVERIARILWQCDCEEADEERCRHKMPPVEKWADPWHISGTGLRQQRKYVFRAERILADNSAPAHPTEPGEVERLRQQLAEQETLTHAYVSTQGVGMQILVDANARLGAEIERLTGDLDEARQKLDLEHSEKEDSLDDLATALTGLDIYRARADILATEAERLRAIETAAVVIANEWQQGNEPTAQMFLDLCAAALSKGPTP